jgi:hypothetical protein
MGIFDSIKEMGKNLLNDAKYKVTSEIEANLKGALDKTINSTKETIAKTVDDIKK